MKAKKGVKRSGRGSVEGEPGPKAPHPEEDVRTRGFDRGLQPEKIIGATDSSGELVCCTDDCQMINENDGPSVKV